MSMMFDSKPAAAMWYRHVKRWSIIPLHAIKSGKCTCGHENCHAKGKHPIAQALPKGSWVPYQAEPAPPELIKEWWTSFPWANIGLITGQVSRVFAVDVDPRHGGTESLQELESQHGVLPRTLTSKTGGGGSHLIFRHPGVTVRNTTNMVPGIDIRGDGGLVVIPCSDHHSGQVYQWEGSKDDLRAPLAPPQWLISLVTSAGTSRTTPARASNSVESWVRLIMDGAAEGARNSSAARLAGLLFRHGLGPCIVGAVLTLWNKNLAVPLANDEIVGVVQSIARADYRRRGRRPWTTL